MQPPADEVLAERTRTGDLEAYAELWQRHAAAGLGMARRFGGIADPDDLVSEAYLQILRALQRGGGPYGAFRPYLYRTIHNVAMAWRPKAASVPLDLTEELEDSAIDLETATIENTITVRAFRTLPDRWQSILWYTEVEGMDPAAAAPLLGLTANAAAALSYRAREGLRKAWLQAHVNDRRVPRDCRWTTERMADYTRDALSPDARARFDEHLMGCRRCQILLEEINALGGHLASLLLPVAIGSAAAAGLLGHAASGDAPAVATARIEAAPVRTARRGARLGVAIAAGAGIALAATAVFASTGGFTPAPVTPPSQAESSEPTPRPSQPRPTPTPTETTDPVPTSPPEDPAAPPQPPPVPPPDRLPPTAPVVAGPVDGELSNDPRPVFAGTGEPGSRVEVRRIAPDGTTLELVASAVVTASGHWTATARQAVPDGPQSFAVRLIDAAGNRSAVSRVGLVIDTVAAPPTVDALPANPLRYLPVISGTSEGGAAIALRDETGAVLGSTVADGAGAWSVPLPDPERDGLSFSVQQVDPAGNRSAWSDPSSPVAFERPALVAPLDGDIIPSNGGATVVQVQITGVTGSQVQVFIDGVTTGNVHTLEPTPIVRVTPPLPDGPHTIGVRYVDPVSGAVGSVATIAFTIAP